jgi:hypothetical protein
VGNEEEGEKGKKRVRKERRGRERKEEGEKGKKRARKER